MIKFKCKICGKIFDSKKEAKKHVRKEHKNEWKTSGIMGTWINRRSLSSFIEEVNISKASKKKSLLDKLLSLFKK